MPALLIRISIFEFLNILFAQTSTSLKFDISIIFELKFELFKSLLALSTVSESMSQIITLAPEFKNLFAISNPNP